ncbi:DUF6622 family protein [Duganella sp. HH101]|uniref:DUF6622 family protein n=1 Tax=Duganella sp. HH101 TaxID=1781066 RepID=UPI000875A02A|nr:DUF6622 family protein [Duganella sp. HH101]OFA04015.1 hypothetical protein DUGA2_22800 [Duganella sp. HH101]
MMQQIISHTPLYVWAVLALLVYRGLLASRDREVSLQKLWIVPVAMLCLSLSSMSGDGVLGGTVWGVWMAGLLAGAALAWKLDGGVRIVVDRAAGTVFQRGSWVPLALMLAIFVAKYAVAVVTAMHPETRDNVLFVVAVTGGFGLFSGMFVGRAVRCVAAWLAQSDAAMA